MRVDPHYVSGLVTSLNNTTLSEQQLTAELSSGLRVTSLSSDPLAVGETSMLASAISKDDSFVQTAASTQSYMQVADSALSGVVSQLTTALSLAVQGNGGTENGSNLVAISQQMSSIRDQIISLANSTYQGTYLFAGSQGNAQPFSLDTSVSPAVVAYHGDSQSSTITSQSGQQLTTSLPGSAVFSAAGGNVMSALSNLVADFASGTPGATSATDIGALRSALVNVSQQQATLGNSMNRLRSDSTYAQTDATTRTAAADALVSADPAKVATQLSAAETQNQALMSTIAALEKQSLFNFIQ
jgi:flagellar hook-associated protein 3 FlgL